MSEQRLIDANAVEVGFDELCQSPYFKNDVSARHGAETLMDLCVRSDSHKPNTINPETMPIVQQLRAELAKVKAERDGYKAFYKNITACGDCNDCGISKTCEHKPMAGETTRFNCHLWKAVSTND